MAVEVAAQGSFDAEPLLRGFEWLGAAIAQQTAATEQLGAKLDSLSKSTATATKETKSLLDSTVTLNATLEIAGKVWGAVTGVIDAAAAKIGGWVRAAREAEDAQTQLAAVTGSQFQAISQYNEGLEKKLGVDKEDLSAAQSRLVALGVSTSKLEEATRATLGYSAATGKDLLGSTKAVAKAFTEGGAEAQRLTDLYRVAEAQSETFSGRIRALDTAMHELSVQNGEAFTQSTAVNQILETLTDTARSLTTFLGSPDGKAMVDAFAESIAHLGADAIDAALGARGMLHQFEMGLQFIKNGWATESLEEPPWVKQLEELSARLRGIKAGPEGGPMGPPEPPGVRLPAMEAKTSKTGKDEKTPALYVSDPFGFLDDERKQREHEKFLDGIDDLRLQRLNNELNRDQFFDKLRSQHQAAQLAAEKQFWGQLANAGTSGVAGFLSGTIAAWASGRSSLAEAAGQAFAGMLGQIGQGLIGLGAAAVAAGLLGSVAPIFAPATGGPAGVGAGLALMAAGSVLVGIGAVAGSALGARPGGPGGGGAGTAGGESFTSTFSGYTPPPSGGGGTTVVNVNLGRGFVFGTPREVGQQIKQLIRQADTLSPSLGGMGG